MEKRACCGRCGRPPRVCYCAFLPSVEDGLKTTTTHVLVLQHPHETRRRQAISTVPVLSRVLTPTESLSVVTVPDDCKCGPGVDATLDRLLYAVPNEQFSAILILFPDATARPMSRTQLQATTASTTDVGVHQDSLEQRRVLLVVIDGTWTEAKKIVHWNRVHWKNLAQKHQAQQSESANAAVAVEYVCLAETDEVKLPSSSLYNDLRREPKEGCMSTLEAIAHALLVLEPEGTGTTLHTALLHALHGMVSVQEKLMQEGREKKLQMYGGVSKAEALTSKRGVPVKQRVEGESTESRSQDEGDSHAREYVIYETRVDFRQQEELVQVGSTLTCTYNEARDHCQQLNVGRKRGQRLAIMPLTSFTKRCRRSTDG